MPHTVPLDFTRTFLPVGPMRQIARVLHHQDQSILGEVDVTDEHWVFAHHFPDDPVYPGCLMVEAAGQLVALWAWLEGARGRPRLVRSTSSFRAPVLPEDGVLRLEASVRRRRNMYFGDVALSTAGETDVARIELVLAVVEAEPEAP